MSATVTKSILLLTSAALIALTGCSSTKKKVDIAAPSTDPVVDQAMNLDPKGSDSGKIPDLSSIGFDFDASALSDSARARLQKNVEWLKKNPTYNLQIEGHCDRNGSTEYNIALGERRAIAVKNYMINLGVPTGRLLTISYGKEKPLDLAETEEADAHNRRANFVPVPTLSKPLTQK